MTRLIIVSSLWLILMAGPTFAGALHTAPVPLSQPDIHTLSCLMANVSPVPIFGIRVEIRDITGAVIESHSQDVLLPQETLKPISANTTQPFIPSQTLRCSFFFRGPNFRVRATGCVIADDSASFGRLCHSTAVAF